MSVQKTNKIDYIIRCPHCGREYLPSEIFYPKHFFGYPMDIERTADGKIDFFSGKSIDPIEEYTCDNCLNKFKVSAKITFKSEPIIEDDINQMHTTKLFEDKLVLDETNLFEENAN